MEQNLVFFGQHCFLNLPIRSVDNKRFLPSTYNFSAHLLNTLVPYFQLIVSKDNYVISQTIKTCKSCECMQRMQHNNIFSKDVPIKQCFIIVIFFFQMTSLFVCSTNLAITTTSM